MGRPRAQLLSPIESEQSNLGISRLNDTVVQKGDRLSPGNQDLTVADVLRPARAGKETFHALDEHRLAVLCALPPGCSGL